MDQWEYGMFRNATLFRGMVGGTFRIEGELGIKRLFRMDELDR
jgi:hypothetical protein